MKKLNDDKIFIVIPAYNEAKNIGEVISVLLGEDYALERIIVVDDGSTDKTYELVYNSGVWALKHPLNLGKGAALKTGADFAIKKGAKKLIFMDSDLQHSAKDIKKFEKKLENSEVVFGYRELNKKMPIISKIGNKMLNFLSKTLFKITINDTQCGFRAMTTNAYEKIKWTSTDYAVETEMAMNVGSKKIKFGEVPIQTIYHEKYKGTTPIHGLKIFFQMIKWRLIKK